MAAVLGWKEFSEFGHKFVLCYRSGRTVILQTYRLCRYNQKYQYSNLIYLGKKNMWGIYNLFYLILMININTIFELQIGF